MIKFDKIPNKISRVIMLGLTFFTAIIVFIGEKTLNLSGYINDMLAGKFPTLSIAIVYVFLVFYISFEITNFFVKSIRGKRKAYLENSSHQIIVFLFGFLLLISGILQVVNTYL
jgi:uncharacterized membrane protein